MDTGLAALRLLQKAADLQLPGPLVATGGGGWHHWFRPTGLGNRPPRDLTNVDWRGRGGCVLDPTTVAALRQHRKRQTEERLAAGPHYADSGLAFTRPTR